MPFIYNWLSHREYNILRRPRDTLSQGESALPARGNPEGQRAAAQGGRAHPRGVWAWGCVGVCVVTRVLLSHGFEGFTKYFTKRSWPVIVWRVTWSVTQRRRGSRGDQTPTPGKYWRVLPRSSTRGLCWYLRNKEVKGFYNLPEYILPFTVDYNTNGNFSEYPFYNPPLFALRCSSGN